MHALTNKLDVIPFLGFLRVAASRQMRGKSVCLNLRVLYSGRLTDIVSNEKLLVRVVIHAVD